MLIAGAGGHSLEVLDVLLALNYPEKEIFLFDDVNIETSFIQSKFKILHSEEEIHYELGLKFPFCLGVGSPENRKLLFNKLKNIGGIHKGIRAKYSFRSTFIQSSNFDNMMFSFISNNVIIGKGVLINTGAKIHHEAEIGDFTEIGPSANILGRVKIGHSCQIGSNVTILPNLNIGNNVIIGAGAVVTKNFPNDTMGYGVPANIIIK